MRRRPWPDARDYCEAIVNPNSLSSTELRSGTLEMSSDGFPKVYAGTFSTTFHFETASGDVAFRCFKRGYDDLQRRYAAIGELLRYVRTDALCRTQYLPEAIIAAGAKWPAVIMEWVPGRALNAEIESRCDDPDAMLALAKNFRAVVRSLEALGIAHGDLQHGNILVSQGKLRLIDYDAMFLPAIADQPQAEYGHRNYQHPERRSAPFDSRLDRFSSIVIYTALIALSADRSLWTHFDNGDNLLFRAHDFTSNGQSELFRTLFANNAASGLAGVLLAACNKPIEQVPTLEQAIQAASGTIAASPPIPLHRASLRRAPEPEPVLPPREEARLPVEAPSEVASPQPPLQSPAAAVPGEVSSNRFARLAGLVALVTALAGLAIGFAIAAWRHGSPPPLALSQPRTVATTKPALGTVHPALRKPTAIAAALPTPATTAMAAATPTAAVTPRARRTAAVTPRARRTATVTPRARPTATVTRRATATPKATAVRTARVTPGKRGDYSRLQGAWQIDEANRLVGTIVWSGDAVVSDGGTLVLDTRKDSVADRSATPCERRTTLHAAIALGVARQIVRYRETNCAGSTSSGEIRVNRFSANAGSFSGSVWQGGVKLGNFTAIKQ